MAMLNNQRVGSASQSTHVITKQRIVDPNGPMAGFPALKQGTNWFLTSWFQTCNNQRTADDPPKSEFLD